MAWKPYVELTLKKNMANSFYVIYNNFFPIYNIVQWKITQIPKFKKPTIISCYLGIYHA